MANVFPKDVQHEAFQPANPLFLIYQVLLTTKRFACPPGSWAYLTRSRGAVKASNFCSLREKGVARGGGVPPCIWLLTTRATGVARCKEEYIGVLRNIHSKRAGFFFVRKLISAPRTACHSAKIFRCLTATYAPKYLYRFGLWS